MPRASPAGSRSQPSSSSRSRPPASRSAINPAAPPPPPPPSQTSAPRQVIKLSTLQNLSSKPSLNDGGKPSSDAKAAIAAANARRNRVPASSRFKPAAAPTPDPEIRDDIKSMIAAVKKKQMEVTVATDVERAREDMELKMRPFLEPETAQPAQSPTRAINRDANANATRSSSAAHATRSSSNFDFDGTDWEKEEDLLNRQAIETKREMAKLNKRRNEIKFMKRRSELKDEASKHLQEVKHATERELQAKVAGLRAEGRERMGEVERFKKEMKDRIDALCRCYEEVSVRGGQMENSFREAEERLIEEAKSCVMREKDRVEAELRRDVSEAAKKLDIGIEP